MTNGPEISASEALERLFEAIRAEAAGNPAFARRLVNALGVTVTFKGTEAVTAADPIIAAARMDFAAFREMFDTFPEKDLKTLIKSFALATDAQVKAVATKPKKIGFIDLMWDGARRKLRERAGG
ncbi:MAG: hypothetical protein JNM89_09300 [Hyphomicrobiaceae bacterium]|nr:hypothetical protein [Hyphomicrobiaceae bacterium]